MSSILSYVNICRDSNKEYMTVIPIYSYKPKNFIFVL